MIAGWYCSYPSMWYTNIQASSRYAKPTFIGKLKKVNTIGSRFIKNFNLMKISIC